MLDQTLIFKIACAVGLFFIFQLAVLWNNVENLDERKLFIEAEIEVLLRKKENIQLKMWDLQKNTHRMENYLKKLDNLVRDRLPLVDRRRNIPVIYFITPTYRRPTQKADLTRLSNTLAHVPNLYWIVIEDAFDKSVSVSQIIERSKLNAAHIFAPTPKRWKLNETDPNWKLPRGIAQRNAALDWLRKNFGTHKQGVVYFGDDDNTYDLRLFDQIRSVNKIGVWPVGIVGGLLVETPLVEENKVSAFNSIWKPERPFPIDMAAFAINASIIFGHKNASFTYELPRGFQESYFIQQLGLKISDLEAKADYCQNVYVWHTRTEKAKLSSSEQRKFSEGNLSKLEEESVG